MAAPPVLILVHGTGAGEPNPVERRWWESEGQTAQDLAKASPDGPAELAPFRWTGRNSEKDRRAAGHALLDELRKYEDATDGREYRLIGHSHGGSVIWHALAESARGARLTRLKGWITVGTPFLQFRPAWTYLWIVLAAAAAVFAAWNATTLLIDAWPDRALVIRHARTYPILGYIIDALVAVTLALGVLAVLTTAGALAVRAFPSLKNVPGRIQFVSGIGLVLAALGGGAWFVVWSDLIHDNAAKAGLWATAALLCGLWVIAASFIAATLLLISRGLDQRRRDRREREAVTRYGPLWQPFTHAYDETVAGLAASRVSPYPVAAPHPGPDASVLRQLFSIAMAPLARVADDFIWWMLMRRLQGADIWGLLLMQASAAPSPLELTFGFSSLADPAAQSLLEDAAKGLGELGSELRAKLVKAGKVPDAVSAVEIVGSAIKWTEVVHTLYFRDIRMMGQLEQALTAKPRTPRLKPEPPAPSYPAYRFLPLTVASCLVSFAVVWGLGQTVKSLHATYVQPYLAKTQIDAATGAWRSIEALAVDKNPIMGEYLVRLVAHQGLSDPAAVLRRIPDEETYGVAAQRLSFAYGFAGQAGMHRLFAQRFPRQDNTPSPIFRFVAQATIVHTLAGFVAAGRKAPSGLIDDTLTALGQADTPPRRATLCTAIPALFAAGKAAEAAQLFIKLQITQGPGCDDAVDPFERRAQPQPPCVSHERIAVQAAMLGAWTDARDILRQCQDADRARLLLLRLALRVDDQATAALLGIAAQATTTSPNETVLRAAALAKIRRLAEAQSAVASLFADPADLARLTGDDPLRPLFDAVRRSADAATFLDKVIAAQGQINRPFMDIRAAGRPSLAHVRMLSDAGHREMAHAAGMVLVDRAIRNTPEPVARARPGFLVDAGEIAGLIGEPAKAQRVLSDALRFGDNIADRQDRAEHFRRSLVLIQRFVPDYMDSALRTLYVVMRGEVDTEVRARLNSVVSEIQLQRGDPFLAMQAAREAIMPYRVIEAYCRFVDQSGTPVAKEWSDVLRYPYWPEPSSTFIRDFAFRDAFGPQACEAPWPIDKRN